MRKALLTVLIAFVIFGMRLHAVRAAETASDCGPIAGADVLWARPQLKWLVVGEIHGSAEMPAAFGDLVCLAAARSRRPIVVGIELPPDEQTRLNAYMASDGGTDARDALFTGPFWHPRFSDGRSSQAWFGLIERMRQLKQQGRIADLVAVRREIRPEPGKPIDQAAYEAQLAEGMRATVNGNALSLIYVGNIHAASRALPGLPYAPAAAQLPADETLSINLEANGGSFWNCRSDEQKTLHCGAQSVGAPGEPDPRGIVFDETGQSPWSATFRLGVPTTASPPAVQ